MACADRTLALKLQLEEIRVQRQRQTGKWPEGSHPDRLLALDAFEAQLKREFREDGKLAFSLGTVAESDAAAIRDAMAEEQQAFEDRELAMSLNEDDVLLALSHAGPGWPDWACAPRATVAATARVDPGTAVAGPSAPNALRRGAGPKQ